MTAEQLRGRATIDSGLPATRQDWPDNVLANLEKFTQGSVVENPPFFYYADPRYPVWARTQAYTPDSVGPEVIELDPDWCPRYGLITTQTCDIVEEEPNLAVRPWVQVCPIEDRSDLDGGKRRLLREGHGTMYLLHVPALPADGFWVADLRIEFPIEKGWLANQAPIDGFNTEADALIVGRRIATIRSRPAFSKNFVEAIQKPLVERLRAVRRENRYVYDRLNNQTREIAVRMDSLLQPKSIQVTLIATGSVDEDVRDWWLSWWDEARVAAARSDMMLLQLDIREESKITLEEYRQMVIVPLMRISPG